MAKRMIRQLIDDLDGSEITAGGGERIEFSVRGTEYQIDLSSHNLAKFDKVLKPYVSAAARVPRRGAGRPTKLSASAGKSSTSQQQAAIRAWARKKGHDVSARGRIPGRIIAAFDAAH